MKDYTKFMNWALFSMLDRKTQDDRKSKVRVELLSSNPWSFENYNAPNKEIKRYILHIEDLEEFERFYNFVQDLKKTNSGKYLEYGLIQQLNSRNASGRLQELPYLH